MLTLEELKNVLSYAKQQQAKAGDLLTRARHSLLEWDRVVREYSPVVEIRPVWYGHVVYHRCSCPAWREDKPCKHVIALILLEHKELLVTHSSKWREFFNTLSQASRSSGSGSPSPSRGASSRRPPRIPPEFNDF